MKSVALVLACAAPFEGPWVPVVDCVWTQKTESIPHVVDIEKFVEVVFIESIDGGRRGFKARALIRELPVQASITVRLEKE